jgi:hypothetical protein
MGREAAHSRRSVGVGLWLNLATDRPQEGCYLSGDRGCRDLGLLAISDEPAIAGTQPHLLRGANTDPDGL